MKRHMDALDRQIEAYDAQRERLERDHHGRWVVFHDELLTGDYATYEEAITAAMRKFGRGPYLVRQVGAPPSRLPASVMFGSPRAGA